MTRQHMFRMSSILVALGAVWLAPGVSTAERARPAARPAAHPAAQPAPAPAAAEAEAEVEVDETPQAPAGTDAAAAQPASEAPATPTAAAPGAAAPEPAAPEQAEEAPRESRGQRFRQLMNVLPETGPIFSIQRGSSSLGIVGSVQLLAVPFIQDPWASLESDSIANTEGFRLRRARLGAAGTLPFYFGYRLMVELDDDGANILDASVSFEPLSLLRVTVGALKVPFSGSMMLSCELQPFIERPYIVRSVAPDRSLGIEIAGKMTWFSYAVGIFNGGGDFYRGDNNDGMLYVVRAAGHPWGPIPESEIGLPRRLLLQVAASYYFNQDAAGDRHAISGELAMRWAGFSFAGEVLWSQFDPSGSPVTDEGVEYGHTEHLGWYVQAAYFAIREHLQVAFRYDGQYVAEALEIQDMRDLWAITAAVNGYMLRGRIKLTLEYQHRHESFEEQVPNDYLGIQLQGRI